MTTAIDVVTHAVLLADDARLLALTQGNFDACAELLSEGLVFVHSSSRIDNKKSYVQRLHTGKYLIAERSDAVVHANGDTAWMLGRTRMQVLRDGGQRNVDARFLSVWVVESGKWKMAAYTATPVQPF